MLAEYIWLDGSEGMPSLRGKTKVIRSEKLSQKGVTKKLPDIENFPDWGFDGGSTEQGTLKDSDRVLKPVRVYFDPFRENSYLVLCEVYNPDGTPHSSNARSSLRGIEERFKKQDPWFGFEQEYTLMTSDGGIPVGFIFGEPAGQGQYYCGVGTGKAFAREVCEEHLTLCTVAGIKLDGTNAEVMPGQWEYQTAAEGPLEVSDNLWVSRYILQRIAEKKSLCVSYDPKPADDWNGAGCHANFSTEDMREGTGADEGGVAGYEFIKHAIKRLKGNHMEHIKVYGTGIAKRLTGECETSPVHEFSSGVGDRGASVRIPAHVHKAKKGYIEDRRPCANIDPYEVCGKILDTVLGLDESSL